MNDQNSNSGFESVVKYRPAEEININKENPPISTGNNEANQIDYVADFNEPITVTADSNPDSIVSVFDVAYYILGKLDEPCTTMKLHKLLYYCQAWYLVWEDARLFKEDIEAWANGPVIRDLFSYHQGLYWISQNQLTLGNPSKLSMVQKEDIDNVLSFYGSRTSQWLIDQTHTEAPWRLARKGLLPNERGNSVITPESMFDFYSSLK